MSGNDVDWIQLAQNGIHCPSLVNTVMNVQVPLKAGYFLAGWDTVNCCMKSISLFCDPPWNHESLTEKLSDTSILKVAKSLTVDTPICIPQGSNLAAVSL
jgi:hypothetical protein